MAEKVKDDSKIAAAGSVLRRTPTAVTVTAIICATVVALAILCSIIAILSLDYSNDIVKNLPRDLHTINITVR